MLLHAGVALVAGIALLWAVVRGTFRWTLMYAFSGISTIFYPWYLGWSIPYAVRMPGAAPWFFISLPAFAHVLDPHFSLYEKHTFAIVDLWYVALLVMAAATLRTRVTEGARSPALKPG